MAAHNLIKVLETNSVIQSADVYGERITSTDSTLTFSVSINSEGLLGNRSAHSARPLMPAINFSIFHGRPESLVVYKYPAVTRAYPGQDWRRSMRCFRPVTITSESLAERSGRPTPTFFLSNSTLILPPT